MISARTQRLISFLLWLSAIAVWPCTSFALSEDEEAKLFKAAFIYNFAKFTTWPAETWSNNDTPLTLCTIGSDPLINELSMLGGKQVLSRTLSIVKLSKSAESEQCHLLYIGQSELTRYKTHLQRLNNQPILTIAELPDFAESGGMIELYRDHGKTRLSINLKKARESGIDISSRLLMISNVIQ